MPYVSVAENATCSVDRSTLALHYSSNLVDWIKAGFVDYTLAYHRHFANPDMLIDGDDLLVVSEASMGGERIHPCAVLLNFVCWFFFYFWFCWGILFAKPLGSQHLRSRLVQAPAAAALCRCCTTARLAMFFSKANGLLAHTTRADGCDQMHACRQLCDDSRSSAVVK